MRPILPTYVIEFNGDLLKVVRTYGKRANLPVEDIKQYYDCTIVLERNDTYYFCQLIEEPEYYDIETGTGREN